MHITFEQAQRPSRPRARDLGYHVNLDINWPTRNLKTKRGRLRFLTKEEELRLLTELDPNRGGAQLVKAHQRLDAVVDGAYSKRKFSGDSDRVAFLFGLYQQISSPLEAKKNGRQKSS